MDPKEAVQILMNDGISLATRMLTEFGEFNPYGRTLSQDLAITDIAAFDGKAPAKGIRRLELVEVELRKKVVADSDIAIGVFSNVTLRDENGTPMDAVRVSLEHEAGYSVDIFFPYTINEQGVSYGELITMDRDPGIYSSTAEQATD